LWFFSYKFSFSNFWFFLFFSIAFFIKLPLFIFHSWLPKAHVEAPTLGSVFLAACLLKLGSYGLFRFLSFSSESFFWTLFICFGIFGGIFRALICFFQTDLKTLIAFSSVAHISIILISILRIKDVVVSRIILLSLSHAFSSGALFFGFGMNYFQFKTRRNIVVKGILTFNSFFAFCWFLICCINIRIPPSVSFFGEIFMYIVFLSKFNFVIWWFLLSLFIFLVGSYNIILFSFLSHGKHKNNKNLFSFKTGDLSLFMYIFFGFIFMFILLK